MLSFEDQELFKHLLIHDEGLELLPYLDCCGKPWRKCQCADKGKLTIGVGRNLDDVGISESEAMLLLDNNITRATLEVERAFGAWYNNLNSARKLVIISMAFNMGINGLKEFKRMIKSIESGNFSAAADQMLLSKWAGQVGARAVRLSHTMRLGVIVG